MVEWGDECGAENKSESKVRSYTLPQPNVSRSEPYLPSLFGLVSHPNPGETSGRGPPWLARYGGVDTAEQLRQKVRYLTLD